MPFAAANRVVMDGIHGLTVVDPRFWHVVDAPEVQRLRWIRQTGLAYLVYPGAEHSRFAHAIGAYGVAKRVFSQLKGETAYSGHFGPSTLDADLELAFTTAALCHDLGHTAFSHVLETLLLPRNFRSHEDCTLELLREGEVGKAIKQKFAGCDLDQVIDLLRGTHWNDGLCKLLSGQIDVDRWDYVMRDAAATGVVYGRYDLDWLIRSLSLHPDNERRPRLLIEAHRGLVAMGHFLSARRSMYQQIYYHPTVRGAERLLRAVFERACDPERPEAYKKGTTDDIPKCLHSVLNGGRPTLGEFIETDDATIIGTLKRWSHSATDPVLRYSAKSLFYRRLFKEIPCDAADAETTRTKAKAVVQETFARQTAPDLPAIDASDMQALDYFVLVDTCEFKRYSGFEGILFDCGEATPRTFDQVRERPEYDILRDQQTFTRTKIFVPADVASAVKAALLGLEKK
jgi:uncharacterized protein